MNLDTPIPHRIVKIFAEIWSTIYLIHRKFKTGIIDGIELFQYTAETIFSLCSAVYRGPLFHYKLLEGS